MRSGRPGTRGARLGGRKAERGGPGATTSTSPPVLILVETHQLGPVDRLKDLIIDYGKVGEEGRHEEIGPVEERCQAERMSAPTLDASLDALVAVLVAGPDVKSVADLAGKTIAIGERYSERRSAASGPRWWRRARPKSS